MIKMKQTTIILTTVIALLFPCLAHATYSWGNFVQDAGFEGSSGSSLSGNWAVGASPGDAVASQTEAHTGSWSAKIVNANGYIYQTVSGIPSDNQNYYHALGFYIKNDNASAASITVILTDNGVDHTPASSTIVSSQGWTFVYVFHTIQSYSNFKITIQSSVGNVYIDDLNFESFPSNGSFEYDVQQAGQSLYKGAVAHDGFPDSWDRLWSEWHGTTLGGEKKYYQFLTVPLTDSGQTNGASHTDGTRCGLLSFIGLIPPTTDGSNSAPLEWVSFFQTINDVRQSFASVSNKTTIFYASLWCQSPVSACTAILRVTNAFNSYSDHTITNVSSTPTECLVGGPQVNSSTATVYAWVQIIACNSQCPVYMDAVKLYVHDP